MKNALALVLFALSCVVYGQQAESRRQAPKSGHYVATAYSVTGITKSGEWTHRHVVAADPSVLPIGTRLKIKAGKYSGEYVVADTGAKIEGRRLDIYMPSEVACKQFGVKRVNVKVIELGKGTHEDAKVADKKVKEDVAKDVSKGVVGNAATETDWNAKGKPVAAAVKADADATPVVPPVTPPKPQ